MKKAVYLLMMLWLASCSLTDQKSALPQIQLWMVQAMTAAAQGIELHELDKAQSNALIHASAELLRRAMSGPEMAAMHRAGMIDATMHATHDWGEALFTLLQIMADGKAAAKDFHQVQAALAVAAAGGELAITSDLGLAGSAVLQQREKGLVWIQWAEEKLRAIEVSPYRNAALKAVKSMHRAIQR